MLRRDVPHEEGELLLLWTAVFRGQGSITRQLLLEKCGNASHPFPSSSQVLPGHVCCPDPSENRASVGFGSSCCGSLPFSAGSRQQCCDGTVHGDPALRCCGRQMVPRDAVCCGDAVNGVAYNSAPDHLCCGTVYMQNTSTAMCCRDSVSREARVRQLSGPDDDRRCCGLQLVAPQLACCHNNGYDRNVFVCADRTPPPGRTNCGNGATCPLTFAKTAFCDQCGFRPTLQTCAVYERGSEAPGSQGAMCWSEEVVVFSGVALTFNGAFHRNNAISSSFCTLSFSLPQTPTSRRTRSTRTRSAP